ncbi:MAG: acyl-CoA dehydrogenase family protein [Thermodesulfobacteriota bacterium]
MTRTTDSEKPPGAGSVYAEIISECDRFARKELRPCVLDADLSPDPEVARGLWRKSLELDLPGLLVSESRGGAGMNPLTGAMVLDRLAMECAGFASIFAFHYAACAAAMAAGSGNFFPSPAGATDDPIPVAALCLPSDPEDMPFAVTEKNGRRVINGSGRPMGNAGLAKTVIVFAGRNGNPGDPVAVRIDPSAAGVSTGEPLHLPGLKMNTFAALALDDVPVEDQAVLAAGDAAGKMMKAAAKAFYAFAAAMAMGCARSALHKAKVYAGQRYQFKKMIIQHQEIQRLLGDMSLKLNMGTAGYLDLLDTERWRPLFLSPDASLVKAFCTDAALDVLMDAIQIHGGYGYMHEYGLEKGMRDVKVLQVLGETNPYLLVRHIADGL